MPQIAKEARSISFRPRNFEFAASGILAAATLWYDTDDEKSFLSAFLPINVLLTLVVYLGLAVLVGQAG